MFYYLQSASLLEHERDSLKQEVTRLSGELHSAKNFTDTDAKTIEQLQDKLRTTEEMLCSSQKQLAAATDRMEILSNNKVLVI